MRKTQPRRWLAALLTLAMVISLAPAALADDLEPSVTVTPRSLSLAVGEKRTLSATVNNGPAGATVIWSSSNTAVATVTNGEVEAQEAGTAMITATYTATSGETYSSDCSVTVTAAKVTELTPAITGGGTKTVDFGSRSQIEATVTPTWSDGATRDLTSSRQDWTARVTGGNAVRLLIASGTGNPRVSFEAVRAGEAEITITVSYRNPGAETVSEDVTCKVTVTGGSKIDVVITEYGVSKREINLTLGDTNDPYKELRAFLSVDNQWQGTDDITWTIENGSNVIDIRALANGMVRVTPKAVGTATLKATHGSNSSTVTCIVKEAGSTGDPSGPTQPGITTDDELPEDVTAQISITTPETSSDAPYTMDPGTTAAAVSVVFTKEGELPVGGRIEWSQSGGAIAIYQDDTTRYELPITWKSDDQDVARVTVSNSRFVLTGDQPGDAKLEASLSDKNGVKATSEPLYVVVKGFKLLKQTVTIVENGSMDLVEDGIIGVYGGASTGDLTCWSDASNIAAYVNGKVAAYTPGTTTFTVSDTRRGFRANFEVIVTSDPNATIEAGRIKVTDVLKFSSLLSRFRLQAGGSLSYITGLNVDSSKGTLYYKYKSESEPGVGVGAGNYYLTSSTGQPLIEDLTFVPKPGYTGDVTISYTAVSGEQNYTCYIYVTVEPESAGSNGTVDIYLTTSYNTPIKFTSTEFNKVCRDKTGLNLAYVTFSQPPERQGTLYTNYSGAGNYGSVVSLRNQYSLNDLDDIWFVPAPGFTGTATVYYTAHTTGTSGESYTGQVTIVVGQQSGSVIGGLHYETTPGGVVRLDDVDFNDYCRDLLDDYQTLSLIRFDSLPNASEGVLYYDYASTSNPGTQASLDTSYYYGTRTPRIDRLVFVAAESYVGTVRIPFTGYTIDGTRFTGNVEINVRSGAGTNAGDIRYTCAPGRTVGFINSDFTRLSQDLTGRTLDYIVFRSLPSTADGSLYYNSTRISTTGTRYSNGSGNRISNLSFRASSSFSGSVDIPFEGRATNGVVFYGEITISSSSSGTSTSRGNIRYTTDSQTAAVFNRYDFDDLSLWVTDRSVSSVRFDIPSTSQGSLYRSYRSSSSPGTRITSSSTSVSASDLDRVAFVPASGFTGTVYLDFTGTAASGGGTFTGTVEIEVGRPASAVTVRYSTRTAPVDFRSADFARSGYTLSSIRLTSLPSSGAGYLYYQYASPARYGRQASTSTTYRTSGSDLISDLTFVPRAGYTGTVSMSYTGTNSNGSTFEGEVLITVSPSTTSAYFNDMGSYNDAQRAAVDFLRENGIASGISSTQYGPEYSITRGDFAVMVYQAFGLTSSGSANAFYDVPSGVYYAQAVNTLRALGIVSGVGNGAYAPQDTLSRQDAVCMVQRAMRVSGWNAGDGYTSILTGYSDASSVASYAQGAMASAIQVGWLPTRSGRLDPRAPLTRVDMAEMIHRVLTY